MGLNFVANLIIWLFVCGIVYLLGTAFIKKLQLEEPWPTILWLLIGLMIFVGVVMPLLGYAVVNFPLVRQQ
jgi:hypothetical protein